MADEKQRATLTQLRGQQAAKMPHDEAKAYVAGSAGMDKNYEGVAAETDRVSNRQQRQQVLGSMKHGGTVGKTGVYKLHKGETVVPNELYKSASDKTPFKGIAEPTPDSYSNFRGPGDMLKSKTEQYARSTAQEAGAYVKHGANGNSVHSKAAAIAPHDKGR